MPLHRSTIIGHPVRQFYAALCIDLICSSRTWAGVLFFLIFPDSKRVKGSTGIGAPRFTASGSIPARKNRKPTSPLSRALNPAAPQSPGPLHAVGENLDIHGPLFLY
jgi:hypothetical protein